MARFPSSTVAFPLVALPLLLACSSVRTVTTSGVPSIPAAAAGAQAEEPFAGKKVTGDVPHTSESVPEIRERGAGEPRPPRGDAAMPTHRIRTGDNAATTPPPGAPPGGTGY